jgi:hypothetical protein
MKRISVVSFQDIDVSDGLEQLVMMYDDPFILFPITKNRLFVESVWNVIKKHGVEFHAYFSESSDFTDKILSGSKHFTKVSSPIKEVIKMINIPEDVLAIAWDDSPEAHTVLHSVEDYGVETWSILDGLDVIDVDSAPEDMDEDEVLDLIEDTFMGLVELMAGYITTKVVTLLTQEVNAHIDNMEGRNDVDPFEE